MENLIPLFPLELVAFPGEQVNLHIFEPRYKDLVNDIMDGDRVFGIPPFINKKIEFGTLVTLKSVDKIYQDGRMDIKTQAQSVFRILQFDNPGTGKKYAQGYIKFIANYEDEDPLMKKHLIEKLEIFFSLIDVINNVKFDEDLVSFDIIHKIGLPIELEYEMLKMEKESERQEYILNYLDKTIPFLKRANKVKEIIKLNGHFRYYDHLSF